MNANEINAFEDCLTGWQKWLDFAYEGDMLHGKVNLQEFPDIKRFRECHAIMQNLKAAAQGSVQNGTGEDAPTNKASMPA
jgi:hypothetical protein